MIGINQKLLQFLTIIALTVSVFLSIHLYFPSIAQSNIFAQGEILVQNSSPSESSQKSTEEKKSYPVVLDGETLFEFHAEISGFPNQDRAAQVSQNLQELADNNSISTDDLKIVNLEGVRVITANKQLVVALIEADAKIENQSLDVLATEYLQKIKIAVNNYRQERTLSQLGLRAFWAIVSTILFILIFKFLNWFFPRISRRIIEDRSVIFRAVRIQNWSVFTVQKQKQFALGLLRIIKWAIILIVLYFYIPLLLSLFPQTERFGKSVFSSFYSALGQVWGAFISYLPSLFVIIITIIATYYLIRLCEPFFKAIEQERVTIPGFYADWAQPTYNLTVILIVALAAAIIFPYLPGFDSPAFQGISLLIGALVTFGGASTIANLIGGFVIIYTRAFQIGDRIKIDNHLGVVLEKTILSTRIRTPNNEIITVPNSSMIASTIINYTASLRDLEHPLILNTTITLGYDLPWRLVHETLVNAALATENILEDPAPYVWQTSLDDFYISYQLRAYTQDSIEVGDIYSELHQNIQDKCAEVGIEILSPHYAAVRDGHQNTIPENYLPKDYKAPGFRLHPLESFFKQNITKNKSNSETGEQ
ncbi:mechanosensitive ion channel family protein [Crocosphaera sp. UHCC 0190]|uniref:mechanosensitive ion channel family protein n=1 Tax=Crocosphaera sp. UHCC 0190 TaxID=3110246 RepID=UPI002B1FE664|nr:mechanosensitive ion channel family protein [Crocosphaera sp. UHCC 0190]MEA5508399.1 mechanosensitive ion channel family protein [Crocosphaera sp. UHCC 0190]